MCVGVFMVDWIVFGLLGWIVCVFCVKFDVIGWDGLFCLLVLMCYCLMIGLLCLFVVCCYLMIVCCFCDGDIIMNLFSIVRKFCWDFFGSVVNFSNSLNILFMWCMVFFFFFLVVIVMYWSDVLCLFFFVV